MEKLTVKQAAERLNVSEFTVRRYIKEGKLKATKKRKGLKFSYEITPAAIADFEAEHRNIL